MSEEQSKLVALSAALVPSVLLLAIEYLIGQLTAQQAILPYFAFALLFGQLLCLIVFVKGQICPGQRSRLIRANSALALYWIVWLVFALLQQSTSLIAYTVCGLCACYAVFSQPKDAQAGRGFLLMAAAVCGLGILGYLSVFLSAANADFLRFNPFAQLVVGVFIANIALVVARNRVQGFIALLPLLAIALLAINAFAVLVWLFCHAELNELQTLAMAIYFVVHVLMAGGLLWAGLKNHKLNYNGLLILFFMAASLPLWSAFI